MFIKKSMAKDMTIINSTINYTFNFQTAGHLIGRFAFLFNLVCRFNEGDI